MAGDSDLEREIRELERQARELAGSMKDIQEPDLALRPANPVEAARKSPPVPPPPTPQAPDKPVAPYVRVVISDDSMLAHLFIYPPEGPKIPARKDDVLEAIAQKGVREGIDPAAVQSAVEQYNATFKSVMQVLIAKGKAAEHGQDAIFEPACEFMERAEFAGKFPEIPLIPETARYARLDEPGLVGWIRPATKGKPGATVDGKVLSAKNGASNLKVATSIAQDKQGERLALRVRTPCVISWKDGLLRTIPLPKAKPGPAQTGPATEQGTDSKDGETKPSPEKQQAVFSLVIADNHMAAWLTIRPPEAASIALESKGVMAWLRKNGLRHGLDGAAVAGMVEEYNRTFATLEQRLVATGVLPENGNDARLETAQTFVSRGDFHQTHPEIPMPEPSGEEFYALVEEKALLAKITPESRGKGGISVKGARLTAKNGTNPFRAGPGASLARQGERLAITAKFAGLAVRRGHEFHVVKLEEAMEESPDFLPPLLDIAVAPDTMSATLTVRAPAGPSKPLDLKVLLGLLKQKNVRHGLKEHVLRNIIERYNAHPADLPPETVAVGTPAEAGRHAELALADGFLDPSAFTEANPSRPIPDGLPDRLFKLVNPGDVVAVLTPETRGKNGTRVDGSNVAAADGSNRFAARGGLVPRRSEGRVELLSRLEGLAFRDGDSVGVLAYQHVSIAVRVEDDDYRALCEIAPPVGLCLPLTVQEIHAAIKKAGVVFGVLWERIDAEFNEYRAQPGLRQFICAVGERPQHGADGRLEFHIDIDLRPVMTPDPNGRIDYRFQRNFILVEQGARIATVHAPTAGSRHGVTVLSRDVMAEDGKPVEIRLVDGLSESADGGERAIIADLSGEFTWDSRRGEMRVSAHKTVESIDLAQGNLTFIGNVTVRQNIEDGMTVQIKGDLTVKGMIRGAKVKVDGNIACEGGIITKENGYVEAGKEIRARFIENSSVRAGGPVRIERAILHSRVYSLETIEAISARSFVIGGVLLSRLGITIRHLGNPGGARSFLQLGADWHDLEAYLEQAAKLRVLREEAEKIDHETRRLLRTAGGTLEGMGPAQKEQYRQCLLQKAELVRDFRLRREESQKVLARIEDVKEASLSVLGYVFPDNTVRFGNVKHVTAGNTQRMRFTYDRENRAILLSSLKGADPER